MRFASAPFILPLGTVCDLRQNQSVRQTSYLQLLAPAAEATSESESCPFTSPKTGSMNEGPYYGKQAHRPLEEEKNPATGKHSTRRRNPKEFLIPQIGEEAQPKRMSRSEVFLAGQYMS